MSLALFLSFFLFSCSPPCRQWVLATLTSDCPPTRFSQACLAEESLFDGIRTEIICHEGKLSFYLSALTMQFPSLKEDPDHAHVWISSCEEKECFVAERYAGGQRLLLPDAATKLLLTILLNGSSAELSVGRYHTCLISDRFAATYAALQR